MLGLMYKHQNVNNDDSENTNVNEINQRTVSNTLKLGSRARINFSGGHFLKDTKKHHVSADCH